MASLQSPLATLLSVLLLSLPLASLRADASPQATAAGKRQFTKCAACHSLEKGVNLMGPSLAGLAGRKAGSVAGFAYSAAMQQSKVVWTRQTLSAFLEKPMEYLPGTVMPFGGLSKPEQRTALIDYLLNEPKPEAEGVK